VAAWGVEGSREHGTATVAWEAAETCHELDGDRHVSA
jgi:hypothetical protein